ncbi:ABC transporter substrate-binding protein [Mycoplasma sp. Ms02]|uniref:ABC transporter substrate-binding protein n=1 Tax=Mycoplasma sp. Ms02 TaxID=353851 RepID=UPI001C8908EA|nr:ABC transporter substrate-binding protein [Mycoplasma sp. Ms02]QZE12212.1 hypothetical protein K4L35_02610 [Mycoplasma sp. Ms02]
MIKNKIKLLIGAAVLAPFPLISVACQSSEKKVEVNYDLGLTTPPLTSLNYVLYNSVSSVVPSIVDTIVKGGPNSALKSILPSPEMHFGIYGQTVNSSSLESFIESGELITSNRRPGSFYSIHDFGFAPGSLNFNQVSVQAIRGLMTNSNRFLSWTATLNDGKSRWSNGDVVKAEDYIDYVRYLTDINTGTQKQVSIERRGFKGITKFITAQNEYLKKFREPYKNPWGYPALEEDANRVWNSKYAYNVDIKDEQGNQLDNSALWPSQNEGDQEAVDQIRQAALEVGLYTGRLYFNISNLELYRALKFIENAKFDFTKDTQTLYVERNGERVPVLLRKNPFVDPKQVFDFKKLEGNLLEDNEAARDVAKYLLFARDENEIRVEYSSSSPRSLGNVLDDFTRQILPVNRAFIEKEIGGLQNFGADEKSILTNGPFHISGLSLGAQGKMDFVKNEAYYNASQVISNKIRIYFNDEQNTESAMFQDGYVAKTRIPAIQQRTYWSDPELKKLMRKGQGFGTLGFNFNLDKETNKDSYIQDKDLRSAIYYAINREIMLFNSGWNNSYPVITWTAFGQAHKSNGTAIEFGFNDNYTKPKGEYEEGKEPKVPVQNYEYANHLSKTYKFEANDRKDFAYLPEVAKQYIELFKAKHPDVKKVNLKYIFNSIEEQKNVGLALKNALNQVFGGFIELELKALPENVYNSQLEQGDFDIAYQNFDQFGSDIDSYIKAFFKTDGIDKANEKTIGFKENPSGGFTYAKYFKELADNENKKLVNGQVKVETENETRERLGITQEVWDKIKSLSDRGDLSDVEYTEKYEKFFSLQFTDEEKAQNYSENKVIEVVAALEKIIRDAAPVVPLMEVDTYWEISRVGGVSSLYTYDLQYAYDISKPPRKDLPQEIKE